MTWAIKLRAPDITRTALLALFGLCGCTQVLGLEKYRPDPHRGELCGAGRAMNASGTCEAVGVDMCDTTFTRDPRGGCAPVLPTSDCPFGGALTAAWPGKAVCAPLALCADQWQQPTGSVGSIVYVLPGAPSGGDGTQAKPFGTFATALAAGTPTIVVGAGKLTENVVVDRPIHIWGNCAEHTAIAAADPTKPVIRFEAGASGSSILGVEFSGGTDGIVADGAAVSVSASWVHDVSRAGVVVKDVPKDRAVSHVNNCLIERTGQRGIVIRGADATIDSMMVRDVGTPGISPAIGSTGIEIEPSGFVPWVAPAGADAGVDAGQAPGSIWTPSASAPSVVTVTHTLIERTLRGMTVEGSTVNASAIAVRDTTRGVVAKWRSEGAIPGTLSLSDSAIERTREIGVEVWDATTTIDRTTIRPASASCPAGTEGLLPGAYFGNGIRARYDRNVTPDTPHADRSTTVTRSVIDGASQAGIHIEGGFLVVDHSIVQNTTAEGCSNQFGDGVAAYSYDFSPATVKLSTSNISGSHRAAVATFGADVDVQGASLDCNARAVVKAAAETKVSGSPSCGCSSSSGACGTEVDAGLARSVITADCTTGSELDCVTNCFENFFQPGVLVTGATVEIIDDPRVAPAVTNEYGCASTGGFQDGQEIQGLFFKDKYSTATGHYTIQAGPAVQPNVYTPALDNGEQAFTENVPGFWPGLSTTPHLDASGGLGMGIFVCTRPSAGVSPGPTTFRSACGLNPNAVDNQTGVPGMTIDIVAKPGPGSWYGPTYSNGGATPVAGTPSAEGGFSFYLNTSPGDYELVLHPPPGKRLNCTPDLMSPHGAWKETDVGSDLHYKIRIQRGAINGGVFLYCDPP